MTNYKILINSKGVPVLVEVPEYVPNLSEAIVGNTYRRSDDYDNRVKAILSDESKHIAFKDEARVIDLLSRKELCSPLIVRTVGQTFDLPENIGVSFEVQWRHNKFSPWHSDSFGDVNPGDVETRTLAILTPKPVKEPTCGDCGQELTLVRPGKHQCDNPNCVQNNSKPESVPSYGDGWISVKDQLPEFAKQVCITLEMDGNARAAKSYPGFRANGGWYVFTIPDKSWVPHDDKHYKITHWQPLPKAPTKH